MARISFRQGIVRHQTDTNGNPTFLQQVGQQVNLLVSPDPTILTFVHGTKDYLYTESVTVLSAWGPFTVGIDAWMYWDLNRVSGIRTFGTTAREPIKSPTQPTQPGDDQHWFNTNFNTWYVWNGATWVEVLRVFAAKMILGTTLASVSSNTPDYTGTQVGLTSHATSGALTFDTSGSPIMDGSKKFFTTEDLFVTGVPTGASLKVNNIVLRAIAQQPIGAFSVVIYSDYNQIVPAVPFNVVNRIYGITEEGANVGDIVNVVTEGVIYNELWDWDVLGASINEAVYIDNTGQIVLFPIGIDSLPVGAVIGKQSIIFDPTLYGTTGGTGITSHHNLTGLGDDDHPIYFNVTRGDARYYPRSVADTTFALTLHNHNKADITDFAHDHNKADITDFAHDHNKADITDFVHTHVEADITDMPEYVEVAGGAMTGVLTLSANPVADMAAATKLYVDGLVSGLVWLTPISTMNLISDTETTPPASPVWSDSYIIPSGALGDWSGLSLGHVVVWDGNVWVDRGSITSINPNGARFGIAMDTPTTPSGTFTGSKNQIATYDNSGVFSSFETPTAQNAVYISSDSSLHAFDQYAYNGVTWTQFGGAEPLAPDNTTIVTTTNVLSVRQFDDGGVNDVSHWQGLVPLDLTLVGLQDTDLTTTAPVDGDALVYDSSTNNWIPGGVTGGAGGGGSPYTFANLISLQVCSEFGPNLWSADNAIWSGNSWDGNSLTDLQMTRNMSGWVGTDFPATISFEYTVPVGGSVSIRLDVFESGNMGADVLIFTSTTAVTIGVATLIVAPLSYNATTGLSRIVATILNSTGNEYITVICLEASGDNTPGT